MSIFKRLALVQAENWHKVSNVKLTLPRISSSMVNFVSQIYSCLQNVCKDDSYASTTGTSASLRHKCIKIIKS